jgi:excisionase family DNA binding protein
MKQKVREKVISELLGVSERTIRNWRASRIIPYTKVGRVVLFDPEAKAYRRARPASRSNA